MEIDFITSNQVKLSIAREILGKYNITVNQQTFDFREIQSINIEHVATDKANQVMDKFNKSYIIDDSGIYIEALSNFPGALLKTVSKILGEDKIIKLLENEKNRNATFVNVLVLGNPSSKITKIFATETKGTISQVALGDRKVDWAIDRIFIPENYGKTLAELSDSEWEKYWIEFKNNLHYEKLGRWMTDNNSR